MASSSALDMPSDREGSTKTSRDEKAARLRRTSDEPDPRVPTRTLARRLSPRSVDEPGDQELDVSRGIELHECIDEEVRALNRLDGAKGSESDRLTFLCLRILRILLIQMPGVNTAKGRV